MQHVGMVRPSRIAQFASQGFVVFAPYYRGNRGGEGRDEFAGADRLDAVNAVDVLKQSPKNDSRPDSSICILAWRNNGTLDGNFTG